MPLDRFAPAKGETEPKPFPPQKALPEICNQSSSLPLRILGFELVACILPDCGFPAARKFGRNGRIVGNFGYGWVIRRPDEVTGPNHVPGNRRLPDSERVRCSIAIPDEPQGTLTTETMKILGSKHERLGSTHRALTLRIRFAQDGTPEDYSWRINQVSRHDERFMKSSSEDPAASRIRLLLPAPAGIGGMVE